MPHHGHRVRDSQGRHCRHDIRRCHRPYLPGRRHVLDFANKAFELLDHLGWEVAGQVLPSLVHGMARRAAARNSASGAIPST